MKNFSGKHFFILNDFTRKDMVDICSEPVNFSRGVWGGGGNFVFQRKSKAPVLDNISV